MKKLLLALFVSFLFGLTSVSGQNIYLADPTIFYENGTYYLYGTGGNSNYGFQVYTSKDMKDWEGPKGASNGYALKKGDSYGSKGFWAPQVFRYKGKYYMAYTADEFIAIASSDSPLGPFRQKKIAKLPADIKQIDPYVFFDEDGKIYLYHVRLTNGNRLFVAELNDDLTAIKESTLKECISATEGWENTQHSEWPVSEGPTILKKDGTYYFFYSTNDFRNIDYAVGYATSDSPYGPWKKYEGNPIISRQLLKHNGTGHGDIFLDGKGEMRYVFHTHHSDTVVGPRQTAIVSLQTSKAQDGKTIFSIQPKTFFFPQLVKKQPVVVEQSHKAPAPLFRDPVTDGAADPVVVWNRAEKCWWMLYTQRRANQETADVAYCYGNSIGVAESRDNGKTWVYRGTLDLDFERGHNTFWAPDVVYENGTYHMFVAYIRGVRNHWGGHAHIVHFTSSNLWDWKYEGTPKLSSDRVIDATLFKKSDGKWRMWYKDEIAGSHTMMAESADLFNWSEAKEAIGGGAHEGPKVFQFHGYYWMLTDEWHGMRIYRSKDLDIWEKQGIILDKPSKRAEDTPSGAHGDVVVAGDKAYVFYFTHPGRKSHGEAPLGENGVIPYELRRSSIQVAPLVFKNGTLVCDRDSDFDFYLPDPAIIRAQDGTNTTAAPVITDKHTFRNPLLSSGPDPWALWHDSCYYYVNTSQDCIVLKRTKDITDLRNAESKTVWRPDHPSYAKDVWAPEIHFLNGKWYLLFAADDGNTDNHQLYCAENTSADPFKGEFKMKGRVSTDKDNNWAIDGTYLEHNGKLYMFWSGWKTRRVSTETQCIWIAEMENPWTLKSERIKISEPELEWERIYKNPDGWTPPYIIYVNEGPQPLKNPEGDKIFLIYSASGCWTPHYQLGMLCADANADLLDPGSWTKSSHSVFRQAPENSVYGTGHNSFFKSPDGTEDWILYHGRDTETDPAGEGDTRAPRAQKITWENGYPVFGKPFPNAMILDKPSGTVSTRK